MNEVKFDGRMMMKGLRIWLRMERERRALKNTTNTEQVYYILLINLKKYKGKIERLQGTTRKTTD